MRESTCKLKEKPVGATSSRPHFEEKAKEKNGITLIALIITIIVILILVGVTVTVALNGGLFDKVKEADAKMERSTIHEQIISAMHLTDEGKIMIQETYNAAKATLEGQGYTVGELQEDGTFEVIGKKGTYKYKITETEIIVKEPPPPLTLNSNLDSIFTNEYYEVYGPDDANSAVLAKLVYQSKDKNIIIYNMWGGYLPDTSIICLKYYEGGELKSEFALRGRSASWTEDGTHTLKYSSSVFPSQHFPFGWTDYRPDEPCSICKALGHVDRLKYRALPVEEFPLFSGEWIIDMENSNAYGLRYLANVLIEYERTEIKEPEEPEEPDQPEEPDNPNKTDATDILTEGATINGETPSSTNPFIPAEFKAVNTATSSWNATNTPDTENGLVIEDANKNQFVWVPVSDINSMMMCKTCGNSANSLNTETAECRNCGENTILVGKLYSDPLDRTTILSYNDPESEDYTAMAKSVAKYKGFYVGRYETSKSSTGIAQSKKSTETEVIVSANANTDGNWNGLKSLCETYSTSSVQGKMIWGSQYDQMVAWTGSTSGLSSGYNTSSNPGTVDTDVIKNIYDLYGNKYEATQELNNGTGNPINRSGDNASGNRGLTARCTYWGATTTSTDLGVRMILYITE